MHVSEIWLPEIRRYLPETPFLLVGTQTDLRPAPSPLTKHIVTSAEGSKMADRLGAHCYVECSALMDLGIQTVIHRLIRAAQDIDQHNNKSDTCIKCGCQIV